MKILNDNGFFYPDNYRIQSLDYGVLHNDILIDFGMASDIKKKSKLLDEEKLKLTRLLNNILDKLVFNSTKSITL
jgi:hypothetical protein